MLAFCASHKALIFAVTLVCGGLLLASMHREALDNSLRSKFDSWSQGAQDAHEVSVPQIHVPNDLDDDELRWGDGSVPPTRIIAHAPGWTIFDRLYAKEGVIFIVTDYPELVPPLKEITSKGQKIEDRETNMLQMEPTGADMRVISTKAARQLFGESSIRMRGVTFLVNESAQYIAHLYHFVAELLFGFWRMYSSLDPWIQPNGHTELPAPKRMIFPHIDTWMWRDYAAMNQFVLRAAFPSMVLEFHDAWYERAAIPERVYTYDRLVLGDRVAAMHGDTYKATSRIAAEAHRIKSNPNWWSTIRMAVLEFSKVRRSHVVGTSAPVITYVSRQKWGRRMLKEEDHVRLVGALEALRERRKVEIHIVELDRLSRSEQIRLAARTTIMMGVHGNGLTALLWMRPTAQTAVIEFFFPGGFARDYQWTAEVLGIRHFGIWDRHVFTAPNLPVRAYPDGFQGNHIPLHAETVIDIIERQLDLKETHSDI